MGSRGGLGDEGVMKPIEDFSRYAYEWTEP
jgi:hypothetical protein